MQNMEQWMKLIACSSYDYMKLMVLELEHQLAELEQRDKQQQQQQAPTAPPRSRSNPFNNKSSIKKSRTWTEIHQSWGQKILSDRAKWSAKLSESSPGTTVTMQDDSLLVVY